MATDDPKLKAMQRRADQLTEAIADLDETARALAEIDRRSAAMLEAQQHSSLRGL